MVAGFDTIRPIRVPAIGPPGEAVEGIGVVAMIEGLERLAREHVLLLRWTCALGWAAVGLLGLVRASRRSGRDRAAWLAASLLALGFGLEMAVEVRYRLSDALREVLRTVGGAEAIRDRRSFQAGLILGLSLAAGVALTFGLRRARGLGLPLRLTTAGLAIGLLGFAVETISLHQLDAYVLIYWSFRYGGLGLAACGLAASRPDLATGSPRPDSSAHARYSVRQLREPSWSDNPRHRAARLVTVLAVLASPEAVEWIVGLFGSG